MKNNKAMLAAMGAALLIGLTGCGSGSGSSSPGGGGTTPPPTGGGSASLGANFTVLGGVLEAATTAGATQDIEVADNNSQYTHTVTSVYSPEAFPLEASVIVVKAGSILFSGHYTSTTATLIGYDNTTAPIPLTSTGAFAHDTLIGGGSIHLPIDKIGNLSFPNGITVSVSATDTNAGFQFHNLTLSATVPIPSAAKTDGQMMFDGTGVPSNIFALDFYSDSTHDLILGSGDGNSPQPITGRADGTNTTYPNAFVEYVYSD